MSTRAEMIRSLVDQSVSAALAEEQQYWLTEVFEKGFPGYANFSDVQLRREMQLRGLSLTDAEAQDDTIEDLLDDDVADENDSDIADDWLPDLLKHEEVGE